MDTCPHPHCQLSIESARQSRFSWYAIIAVGNDTSISIGLFERIGVGRIQGSSIWEVQKDTEFNEDEAPSKLDLIIRTGAGQLNFPIRDRYIPTPTLPVVG